MSPAEAVDIGAGKALSPAYGTIALGRIERKEKAQKTATLIYEIRVPAATKMDYPQTIKVLSDHDIGSVGDDVRDLDLSIGGSVRTNKSRDGEREFRNFDAVLRVVR